MEIINVNQDDSIKIACYNFELVPNIRQRMYLWINEYRENNSYNHPFTFELYTSEWHDWAAKLSVDAHNVSKDYIYYEELHCKKILSAFLFDNLLICFFISCLFLLNIPILLSSSFYFYDYI